MEVRADGHDDTAGVGDPRSQTALLSDDVEAFWSQVEERIAQVCERTPSHLDGERRHDLSVGDGDESEVRANVQVRLERVVQREVHLEQVAQFVDAGLLADDIAVNAVCVPIDETSIESEIRSLLTN